MSILVLFVLFSSHAYVLRMSHDFWYNSIRPPEVHDICPQMNAKLKGEEFNRHNPPKKVDIFDDEHH